MEIAKIRQSTRKLYDDIDSCITDLLKARLAKDSEEEGKALFRMEGLMVWTAASCKPLAAICQREPSTSRTGRNA